MDPGRQRRGWHDHVTSSIVVDVRPVPVEERRGRPRRPGTSSTSPRCGWSPPSSPSRSPRPPARRDPPPTPTPVPEQLAPEPPAPEPARSAAARSERRRPGVLAPTPRPTTPPVRGTRRTHPTSRARTPPRRAGGSPSTRRDVRGRGAGAGGSPARAAAGRAGAHLVPLPSAGHVALEDPRPVPGRPRRRARGHGPRLDQRLGARPPGRRPATSPPGKPATLLPGDRVRFGDRTMTVARES